MSALPIEVRATDPPSQHVEVLGQRVFVGPSHPQYETRALIVVGQNVGFVAIRGVPSASPLPPPLAGGISPIAEVRLPACAAAITNRDITLLNPDGSTT